MLIGHFVLNNHKKLQHQPSHEETNGQKVRSLKVGVVYHPDMLLHTTIPGDLEKSANEHPENPKRMKSILGHSQKSGLLKKCEEITKFDPVSFEIVKLIHSKEYFNSVQSLWPKERSAQFQLIADTYYNKHSSRAALLAIQAAKIPVDKVMTHKWNSAFLPIRHPGYQT